MTGNENQLIFVVCRCPSEGILPYTIKCLPAANKYQNTANAVAVYEKTFAPGNENAYYGKRVCRTGYFGALRQTADKNFSKTEGFVSLSPINHQLSD